MQYVGLDGDVGVIANGAGLAMATCDIVHEVGGRPANFLDIGGGANAQVMANALAVINNDPKVKSIFINIFGGITKGEEVANGIVQALRQVDISSPIVIRLDGTNAEQGREILSAHESDRLVSKPTMVEAARTAVAMAKGAERMSILVNADTKVIVQGLTGGQGRFYGLRNRAYGTKVVGGVSPKKAGTDVDGIPVFASVKEAVAETGATATMVIVPAPAAGAAVLKRRKPASSSIVAVTEGIPMHDEASFYNRVKRDFPGRAFSARTVRACSRRASATSASSRPRSRRPGGPVGIVSRSGTLTYQALNELAELGHRRHDVRRHRR